MIMTGLVVLLLIVSVGFAVSWHKGAQQNAYFVDEFNRALKTQKILSNLLTVTQDDQKRKTYQMEALTIETKALKHALRDRDNFIVHSVSAIAAKQKEQDRIIRNLRQLTAMSSESTTKFAVDLTDSLLSILTRRDTTGGIYVDTLHIPVQVARLRDTAGWYGLDGIIRDGRLVGTFWQRDSIVHVTYDERIPKRHWLDFFRPWRTVVKYKNLNPNSNLLREQTLVVEDRKRRRNRVKKL